MTHACARSRLLAGDRLHDVEYVCYVHTDARDNKFGRDLSLSLLPSLQTISQQLTPVTTFSSRSGSPVCARTAVQCAALTRVRVSDFGARGEGRGFRVSGFGVRVSGRGFDVRNACGGHRINPRAWQQDARQRARVTHSHPTHRTPRTHDATLSHNRHSSFPPCPSPRPRPLARGGTRTRAGDGGGGSRVLGCFRCCASSG